MNEKYPLALPTGTVLAGQYIVEKVLGQGGFGITYEAVDYKTSERVAVKEFFPDAMATRTNHTTVLPFSGERGENYEYGKTCFLQEAETLAQFIGNENIVRIHSYFEENGTAYFVMDFIEGTSFDDYLRQQGGKISYEEAAGILVPVMDALSVVHSRGIVHRDVTPDNIYITKEGVVKLLDFGAARYSLGDQSRSLDIILKHGFAPKEQYTRRGKQGPYTDIYALGATFYFALTGKRPPDSVERLDEDDLVPPSSLGVQISAAAEDAILKALSVQPADRFQNMMAFKGALLNLQQPAAVQPPLAAVGSPSPVSQTYFTAPDQTSIPRSGSVGGPAPEPGQDTDLQDLASTMKTAGKLAGKLAGKMAGKVAEKTAETAGIMAGTAGKMSEIMAAKKVEAAEKLAAKMAEREAEKAARAAERAERQAAEQAAAEAARQAAEQAAAEAARNAAEGAPDSTAGHTVGIAGEPPLNSTPAKPAMNKKLLLVPVGAAAVILIGVFAFVLGGNRETAGKDSQTPPPAPSYTTVATPAPTATPKPTATPTPEPTPSPTPAPALSGNLAVIGSNSVGNIMNGGIYTTYNSTGYYVLDGGYSICAVTASSTEYVYEKDNKMFSNQMVVDEKLYFLWGDGFSNGGSAFYYDLNTGETVNIPVLNDRFGSQITQLLLTEDYYVVGQKTSDGITVYRVSRADGDVKKCCATDAQSGPSSTFTLSNDGWLYYTGRQDGLGGLYRMRLDTLEVDRRLIYNKYAERMFGNPIVVGDYLYASMFDTESSFCSVIRIDREAGYTTGVDPIWKVSDELNFDMEPGAFGFNVNTYNGEVYFYAVNPEDGAVYMYKMNGNEDGSCNIELIVKNGFCPNLTYYKDGSYDINYFYSEDGSDFIQYFVRYDSEGNQVKTN